MIEDVVRLAKIARKQTLLALDRWGQNVAWPLQKLGAGSFNTAYTRAERPATVIYVSRPETYDKALLADAWRDADREARKHLPAVRFLGNLEDGSGVYLTRKYDTPLRARHKQAWSDYRVLEGCWRRAQSRVGLSPYQKNDIVVECASGPHGVQKPVAQAVATLAAAASNYGEDIGFEFEPRNLATDKQGRLILLDPTFDVVEMRKISAEKQRAYEARERARAARVSYTRRGW